jgi:hypothetical protein
MMQDEAHGELTSEQRSDLLQGRHDGANGFDERGQPHSAAYWVGYREGLLARDRRIPGHD